MLFIDSAEYIAVTIKHHSVDATVASVYARPGVTFDPMELIQVLRHCADIVFTCGDYNAHYESWRDSCSDTRGKLSLMSW